VAVAIKFPQSPPQRSPAAADVDDLVGGHHHVNAWAAFRDRLAPRHRSTRLQLGGLENVTDSQAHFSPPFFKKKALARWRGWSPPTLALLPPKGVTPSPLGGVECVSTKSDRKSESDGALGDEEITPMNAQWIGSYWGTNTGTVVADLDDIGTSYAGDIFVYDDNPGFPRTFAHVELPKGQSRVQLPVNLFHMERDTGAILSQQALAQRFPGVQMPTYADTEWDIAPNVILVKWKTNIGTYGDGKMQKSGGQTPSTLTPLPKVNSWEKFKKYVLTLEPYQFAFRGHENNTWRLRTAFHRTGRASLLKFMSQDVSALHRHLSGLTTHRFNLADALDYAAFLHLAQHHGYPTPILDWTQSPFVAAYFAFRDLRKYNIGRRYNKVRVLILNTRQWVRDYQSAMVLMPGFLHMTVLEPLATNNPRALPQQSISTVTNIDDLERYIGHCEALNSKSYLRAIDIPARERTTVMKELALMGITAGSLFPGIDGACLQLKERFFDL
jgi:hypothetical protein